MVTLYIYIYTYIQMDMYIYGNVTDISLYILPVNIYGNRIFSEKKSF